MFTGIVEAIGTIEKIESEGTNVHFMLSCTFNSELKIDQSLAHDGVCLTVVECSGDNYVVTAIEETMSKTNLSNWSVGDKVNLERCMMMGDRYDGHMVQGHVDQTAICTDIEEEEGSYRLTFKHEKSDNITVEKGSICINGVSLTVVNSKDTSFSVAIIPYTFEHTNFHTFKMGTVVNIEFDILGKYIAKMFIKDL